MQILLRIRTNRNLQQSAIIGLFLCCAILSTVVAVAQERTPAVLGVLPGGPIFDADRPIPKVGNVLELETLMTPPEGFIIEIRNGMPRRNNFYKPDNSDGLYRWAASGHWSNYDESKVGDWKKTVPDILKMSNGETVKDAETWRKVRRPEIVKLLETNVYGKIPANLPKIEWMANKTTNADGSVTTVATGRYVNADGTAFANPAGGQGGFGGRSGGPGGGGITVTYTVPANATGAVPLVQVQGGNAQQVLAMGFGTVSFNGQAPNVTSQPPAPDDWGAIRKYGWVVSRGIDYLETDKSVDAHQIALTGHSIGGKQALVAGCFDERVGYVFASCSGEGGASMMKRDWGETIDDMAQLTPQNYCLNYQKWVRHWDEMPVDAHMLVSLMAPRPVMITGGSQDQWSDPVGVFWTGYYAGPAYKVLGKSDLGITSPPEQNKFFGTDLVYYHHIGGHITTPEEREKYHAMIKSFFKVKPVSGQ